MNPCFPITSKRNLQSSEPLPHLREDPYVLWCERRTVGLQLTAVYSIVYRYSISDISLGLQVFSIQGSSGP